MYQEPDLAAVAALIGDPTRATILSALLSGEALPASELAYRAQVTPQTTSFHLARLVEGGLIKVTAVGRHRYYALQNQEVAQTLETLQRVAPSAKPLAPRAPKIPRELRHARTCYDHLAGKLGVAVTNAMIEQSYIIQDEQDYSLTEKGRTWFEARHVDPDALKTMRRKFAYACLDWSERRFHIAGSLGASLADLFFRHDWVRRIPHSRALAITITGKQVLKQDFGIELTGDE